MKETLIKITNELKQAIIIWGIAFISFFILCYIKRDIIYSFITNPITIQYKKHYSNIFVYTSMFESFTADLLLSLYTSLLASLPIFLCCVYWFIAKSLYKKEKQFFASTLMLSLLLFFSSMWLVYCYILPHCIRFFIIDATNAQPMLKISDYISCFFYLLLIAGIIFQFPIIMLTLVKTKLVKQNVLQKNRKKAIVAIFIIAAIITPPDVISQLVVATILIIIYEITNSFIVKLKVKKKNNKYFSCYTRTKIKPHA